MMLLVHCPGCCVMCVCDLQKDGAELEKAQRRVRKVMRGMEQFLYGKLSYRPKLFTSEKGQMI